MTFDRIARRWEKPKPIRLEPPETGDPCSDPKCGGKIVLAASRKFAEDHGLPLEHAVLHEPYFFCDACGRSPGGTK